MRPIHAVDTIDILSILRAIAGQLDFPSIISIVSREISPYLPHAHLDVALMNATGSMVTAYETGLHTEWDAATTATKAVAVSPIRELFYGQVDHILTTDARNDPRFHFPGAFSQAIFTANLRSRLHVPLKVEGKVIGALSFSTQQVGTYLPEDVDVARTVADILSPYVFALQQSTLRREVEIRQVESEARAEGLRLGALNLTEELEHAREAIGMDLHDQTLADLSRVSRSLGRLATRDTLRGSELDAVLHDVENCVRELRVIIDDAKPSVLQFFGFGQAVEAHLEGSVRASGSDVRYTIVDNSGCGADELPPNTTVALYRIVQEAINNALRHANASAIEVRIERDDDGVVVVVEDDGMGIRNAPGRKVSGLGNIITRASLIRAQLKVSTGGHGKGTCLEIRLPSQPEALQH